MASEIKVKITRMKDCPISIGGGRYCHSIVGYQGALYIYGGYGKYLGVNQGLKEGFLNDMVKYDLQTHSWSKENTNGQKPGIICGHTAVVYKSSMFIFGGNYKRNYSNNLFEYIFNTKTWSKLTFTSDDLPVPRMHHSAIVYDDRLWIFGGMESGHKEICDMWTIRCWGFIGNNWEKVKQNDEYTFLSARSPTIAVVRDEVYAVGKENVMQTFRFNLEDHKWTKPKKTPITKEIYAITTFDNQLIMFGQGIKVLHCYDLNLEIWSDITHDTDPDIISDEISEYQTVVFEDALYIFGGELSSDKENPYSSALYKVELKRKYRECSIHDDYKKILSSNLFTNVEFVVGEKEIKIPAHVAVVAARSEWLRTRIKNARALQEKSLPVKDFPMLQVRIPKAVPEVFKKLLNYIYTGRIEKPKGQHDSVMFYLELYRLAEQISLKNLEYLIIELLTDEFLDSTITSSNVLDILSKVHSMNLLPIKEYCLSFIIKDIHCNELVKSKEFQVLDKCLILEVFKKKLDPALVASHLPSSEISADSNRSSLEKDMEVFLKSIGHEFSDVTLLLGEYSIPAHKCILAARSSYFEAKFRSFDSLDNIVCIQIGEIVPSKEVFDILLKYIYYGDANIPMEHSIIAFLAADYFGFTNCNQLQEMIKANVKRNATFEQMLQLLEEAHLVQQIDMKNYLLELIVERCTNISCFPKDAISPDLLLDITNALVTSLKNIQVNTEEIFH